MLLRYLPDELVLMVGEALESQRDLNALVRTSRRLHELLNVHLYRYNVRCSGGDALPWAAFRSKVATAQRLIDQGADINAVTSNGLFPLYMAAVAGSEEVVRLLLESGKADVSSIHGPLSEAARNGHAAVVKLLLATDGVDPDVGNDHGTPLLWAARNGYAEIVRLLLATGRVNPDARCPMEGRTPLWWAADAGHEEVVKLLLAADGVDPNSREFGVEEHEDTMGPPLTQAAACGHDAVVRLLLATGMVDPHPRDSTGRSPLSRAAFRGHTSIVQQLIATGQIDINRERIDTGAVVLNLAAYAGWTATVQLLLDNGAQPDIPNNEGWSALSLAAGYDDESIGVVQLLLQHGAEISQSDTHGWTPLHKAAARGHLEMTRFLIRHGAPVEAENNRAYTPLHEAVREGRLDVVRLLVQHGAQVELRELKDGDSEIHSQRWGPLHYATHQGNDDMALLALEHGARINAECGLKCSSLHKASDSGEVGTMILLLERGADIDAEDSSGWTALSHATYAAHPGAVKELLSRKARVRSDEEYATILQMVAAQSAWDVIPLLAAHKGRFCAGDPGFADAVQLACSCGPASIHQYLLRGGIDPREPDEHGWTLLYSARMSRGATNVKLVLPPGNLPLPGERTPFSPTMWSTTDKSPFLSLDDDNNTLVRYPGGQDGEDSKPAGIRANHAIPLHHGTFYFEVTVLNYMSNKDARIAIGLCHGHAPLSVLTGWYASSWGYHGDDGYFFENSGRGKRYGPTFRAGDVVGCRYDAMSHRLTYYLNGEALRTASTNVAGKLYPTIALGTYGAGVRVNFGAEPFRATTVPETRWGSDQFCADQTPGWEDG